MSDNSHTHRRNVTGILTVAQQLFVPEIRFRDGSTHRLNGYTYDEMPAALAELEAALQEVRRCEAAIVSHQDAGSVEVTCPHCGSTALLRDCSYQNGRFGCPDCRPSATV